MLRFGSSYRERSLTATLAAAKRQAARLGISRVTDITRLDFAGIPVFASVRPGAQPGSLCVNAGKGLTPQEARVGAYMESIEFACAEPAGSALKTLRASAADVLGADQRRDAILDFCPARGVAVDLTAPLECVVAEELSGAPCLVPAELVFFPFDPPPPGLRYFGANTNGLASGNSVVEASLHALFEGLERDIKSFHLVRDSSRLVPASTLPSPHRAIVERLIKAGLSVWIRCVPNEYGVHFFMATLYQRDALDPIFLNRGYGCHLDPRVALTRALTEAAQSRLTVIHGARDDLVLRTRAISSWDAQKRRAHTQAALRRAADEAGAISFRDCRAPDAVQWTSLEALWNELRRRVRHAGFKRMCRVVYTRPDDELQVVRIIVPQLEYFTELNGRTGKRLARYAAAA